MPHRWLILGAGGHGRSVADAIRAQGDVLLGFLDDSRPAGELVVGVPVIRALSLAREFKALPCPDGSPAPDRCVVAIGHPALRQRWQQVLEASDAPLGVVVHPRACVSPSAQLAPGCVVLAGAVVNADAQLERGVLVNSGAVVDHDAFSGSYSQLGVNAAMACCSLPPSARKVDASPPPWCAPPPDRRRRPDHPRQSGDHSLLHDDSRGSGLVLLAAVLAQGGNVLLL